MDEQSSQNLTFEQAMKQLEDTVRRLESGDLPLGESIEQYKRAMTLVQFCRQQLDKAELEIVQLIEQDGNLSTMRITEAAE
ncbi:exodeoxyribonuclease VII small subunit [Alicyclobacillus mengziensis]|uniref:Exodeoxyribonuclease 7 small subunit n=1 Tax=Alicyclobacillus mengziensis TaxID=2931921 RepID=A0A9X7Z502_9BACL|nr:exodeoxyribonuclease VII small subunit [Alicyclobacillus mengziensis]QSO45872.1 exodeoxyribonuclease VII small subunit [Alicyclobacillus mengziensis]